MKIKTQVGQGHPDSFTGCFRCFTPSSHHTDELHQQLPASKSSSEPSKHADINKQALNHESAFIGQLKTLAKINRFPSSVILFLSALHEWVPQRCSFFFFFSLETGVPRRHMMSIPLFIMFILLSAFITHWKRKPRVLAVCVLAGHETRWHRGVHFPCVSLCVQFTDRFFFTLRMSHQSGAYLGFCSPLLLTCVFVCVNGSEPVSAALFRNFSDKKVLRRSKLFVFSEQISFSVGLCALVLKKL